MRENSEGKKNKIVAIIILSTLFAVIIGLSAYAGFITNDLKQKKSYLKNAYQSAYYSLMLNINNIENDLAKTKVIYSVSLLEATLEKVVINSELATNNLTILTNNNYNTLDLMKFFNQIGDYSNFTLRKVEKETAIPAKNMEILANMSKVAREIGVILGGLQDHIEQGTLLNEALNNTEDMIGQIIGELGISNIEYPILIYDGPFSDGVNDREAKGVTGEMLNQEQASELLGKYLKGYNIKNINNISENDYRIPSYLFDVVLDNNMHATVQMAKKGGMLLMLDIDNAVQEPKLTIEECLVLAKQYCANIGLNDMEAVWVNNNNSTVYVNMCYKENGVICYPDMIKLKISLETGAIIGYEGLNYAFNHTKRESVTAIISEDKARADAKVVLDNIEIRRVIIPHNVSDELHCYEVVGEMDGEKYYLYIDIFTGDEVRVLRMIDSNQGELLM